MKAAARGARGARSYTSWKCGSGCLGAGRATGTSIKPGIGAGARLLKRDVMNVWEERWGFVSVHTCGRDPAAAGTLGSAAGCRCRSATVGADRGAGGDVYQGLLPGQAPRPRSRRWRLEGSSRGAYLNHGAKPSGAEFRCSVSGAMDG